MRRLFGWGRHSCLPKRSADRNVCPTPRQKRRSALRALNKFEPLAAREVRPACSASGTAGRIPRKEGGRLRSRATMNRRQHVPETAPGGEGLKVLVIDDDRLHAETIAESLERVGFTCVVATSGRAGAQKLDEDEFDVIL